MTRYTVILIVTSIITVIGNWFDWGIPVEVFNALDYFIIPLLKLNGILPTLSVVFATFTITFYFASKKAYQFVKYLIGY